MTRVGGWVARGAAGFAGLALWLDVARAFAGRGRPAEWWLSFYGAPWAAAAWTLAAAALLTAFSLWPTAPEWRRRATLSVLAVGAAVAVWDGVSFYRVLASGTVRSSWPVPLSVFVAVGLFYRMGYMKQALSTDGQQLALDRENVPERLAMATSPRRLTEVRDGSDSPGPVR